VKKAHERTEMYSVRLLRSRPLEMEVKAILPEIDQEMIELFQYFPMVVSGKDSVEMPWEIGLPTPKNSWNFLVSWELVLGSRTVAGFQETQYEVMKSMALR
jgi:hypothetical protein